MASSDFKTRHPDLKVWALTTARAGDNAQALALALALSDTAATHELAFNRGYALPNLVLGPSLATLAAATKVQMAGPFAGPMPDLVVAAGRRTVPVSRWIKARSGGRTKIIQIGRPRAPLDAFDLVVSTPQYGLPEGGNVIVNALPLTGGTAPENAEISYWRDQLAGLPRPWIAVLAGGHSFPYAFDAGAASGLGERASALAETCGGALLVTTSPRTSGRSAAALIAALRVPAYSHRWRAGAQNPYAAFLALADEIVVTGDSVSMLADACGAGKPVRLFALSPGNPVLARLMAAGSRLTDPPGPLSGGMDRLARAGVMTRPRDLARVHERLEGLGLISPFDGTPSSAADGPGLKARELDLVLARISSLL